MEACCFLRPLWNEKSRPLAEACRVHTCGIAVFKAYYSTSGGAAPLLSFSCAMIRSINCPVAMVDHDACAALVSRSPLFLGRGRCLHDENISLEWPRRPAGLLVSAVYSAASMFLEGFLQRLYIFDVGFADSDLISARPLAERKRAVLHGRSTQLETFEGHYIIHQQWHLGRSSEKNMFHLVAVGLELSVHRFSADN
jgi:hypothetical protein